ncbi:hypothetical protein [Arthrobacter sp. Soil763]|uniref:hypothetical protein n=1 Tax=Arthrobacter sp. Soil763 TaxID=1736402 RepID=UPI0006F8CA02|nr:hypothetical protein [Arthrobacter sp. Soil763]KRE81819.1 hypothetical protein ASG71_01810 [Arthrobacter sp. Soil763]
MTELLTITGTPGAGAAPLGVPYSPAAGAGVPPLNPASKAPSHCGTPMTWAAPALDPMSAHTFGAGDGALELPPVWRCSCGFQLDGVVHTSNALASLS